MVQVTHDGKVLNLSLNAKFVQYNCSAKMFGRITPKIVDESSGKEAPFGHDTEALFNKHKIEILKDWGTTLHARDTYDQLRMGGANPIFPNDSGRYPPNVIMYADKIDLYESFKWYNNGRALVEELTKNQEATGFRVFPGPLYSNIIYGFAHYSRVWMIVPPKALPYLVSNQNPDTKMLKSAMTGTTLGNESHRYTKEDREEIKAILKIA